MLLLHDILRAASRAACTAGSSKPTSTPMMAITTNNSTNVNPLGRDVNFLLFIFPVPIRQRSQISMLPLAQAQP